MNSFIFRVPFKKVNAKKKKASIFCQRLINKLKEQAQAPIKKKKRKYVYLIIVLLLKRAHHVAFILSKLC